MTTASPAGPAAAVTGQLYPLTAGGHPHLGPHGAPTHGSTRVSSGRPQARACSSSWNMGSDLKTAARPLPGTSTMGRSRVGGSVGQGQQPPLTPLAAGSSLCFGTSTRHAGGQARAGLGFVGGECGEDGQLLCPDGPFPVEPVRQPQGPCQGLWPLHTGPGHPICRLFSPHSQDLRFFPTSQKAHTSSRSQTYCRLCLQVPGPTPFKSSRCFAPARVATSGKPSLMSRPTAPPTYCPAALVPSLEHRARPPQRTQPRPSACSLRVLATCI